MLSDPASRRPQRRRALKATIGWSYELLFPDDQRGLWALATFAGGAPLPAVEAVLDALDVPASAAIDVVGRLASRSLVIVDDAAGLDRYRLLDSIRAFALDAMTAAGLTARAHAAHAAWFGAAARSSTQGVRSARQAEHLAFARAERANIDAALDWCATRDPLLGLRIVNGFGWAWIVLGDSRGAQRLLAALDAAGDAAAAADRAGALLLAAWIEASTGQLVLAREHIAAAAELSDAIGAVDLQARCSYYLAYVVSHDGEFARAMELTDHSSALYDGLDRPWDQAASWLFALRAAISAGGPRARARGSRPRRALAGSRRRSVAAGSPRRDARRAGPPRAPLRRRRRASRARGAGVRQARLPADRGLSAVEPRTRAVSGRRLRGRRGDARARVAKAEATGDVRLAALARVHLGRVLRALGRVAAARAALRAATAWHDAAGGGEQSALGRCLLAAIDAGDRVAGAGQRLVALVDEARLRDDAPVEVFALDALARIAAEAGQAARARDLCEAADRRMRSASHFITERDRTDARAVRQMA